MLSWVLACLEWCISVFRPRCGPASIIVEAKLVAATPINNGQWTLSCGPCARPVRALPANALLMRLLTLRVLDRARRLANGIAWARRFFGVLPNRESQCLHLKGIDALVTFPPPEFLRSSGLAEMQWGGLTIKCPDTMRCILADGVPR